MCITGAPFESDSADSTRAPMASAVNLAIPKCLPLCCPTLLRRSETGPTLLSILHLLSRPRLLFSASALPLRCCVLSFPETPATSQGDCACRWTPGVQFSSVQRPQQESNERGRIFTTHNTTRHAATIPP